ncbi:MAG: alpha-hydroxy-acid oxidizing protein [Acidibacillus sp.]|nr:alpha-hydroxy-acid oxidizing protein [Acidibacillus sp.]
MTTYGLDTQFKIYASGLMGANSSLPVSFSDWEQAARSVLADGPFGYVAGGAGAEDTMKANRDAFSGYAIRPRMLNDVSDRDLTTTILGQPFSIPLALAPIGVQSIIHPDAERAPARAAADLDVPFILSTVSSVSIEDIAKEMNHATRWFQLYPGKDPEVIDSMIARAQQSGYSAIVVTVDTTMLAWRELDLKNAYLPFLQGEGIANYVSDPVFISRLKESPKVNPSAAIEQFLKIYVNPGFTWADLKQLRDKVTLPMFIKGITHPDDAKRALEIGMDGIIVSNHGGRQVDGAISALSGLVEIRKVVQDDVPLLFDSGIRHAADIVKALALGAKAVLLGRPYAYAMATAGEQGVHRLLTHLRAELDLQLSLAGVRSVADINESHITSISPR